jgi:hypothetical protein
MKTERKIFIKYFSKFLFKETKFDVKILRILNKNNLNQIKRIFLIFNTIRNIIAKLLF